MHIRKLYHTANASSFHDFTPVFIADGVKVTSIGNHFVCVCLHHIFSFTCFDMCASVLHVLLFCRVAIYCTESLWPDLLPCINPLPPVCSISFPQSTALHYSWFINPTSPSTTEVFLLSPPVGLACDDKKNKLEGGAVSQRRTLPPLSRVAQTEEASIGQHAPHAQPTHLGIQLSWSVNRPRSVLLLRVKVQCASL